ncbi:MAG TPA: adenylate/guanylate cyclase domain-containing protein [Casimicrobiaceae bacterium]|nr:adenylate/guanylate cyclase domain-containing protein [Casimicrobiaceae bacterium]
MTPPGGTLLIVDDNEMNRDLLSRRMVRKGHEVIVAENGQAALNKLLERKFDLVLLDIEMPGIDGVAVLQLIRKTYSMTELPVIMVTARGESEDIAGALEMGANDYIMKPLDLVVVPARVRTQLALKRVSDEARTLTSQLEARNTLIRKVFGRYVANEVVDKLLESPEALEFGGELRTVTALVADLRGFTLISEGPFTPAQIVQMLNNFLGAMTRIIADHHGIVDEIIGDGMLAFFGAPNEQPDHSQRAIGCAVAMQKAMEAVNAYNQIHGLPELSMGVGIHTGEAIVGNIGSETRSKYSVVGKHINLASRIESYSCGNQILISEATLLHAGAIVRLDGQMIVHPKGVPQPVTVYEVGGIAGTYNSFLPHYSDMLQPLAQPVAVTCAVVDEKSVSEERFAASVTKLSSKAAEIVTTRAVRPLTNIAIYLDSDGSSDHTTCLYGKVVGSGSNVDDSAHVRFTCMLPQTASVIAGLLSGRPAQIDSWRAASTLQA